MNATRGVAAVRDIPGYSIVRLSDGRVGYLEKNTGNAKSWVVVDPGQLAVEVSPTKELQVLHRPIDLAYQWVVFFLGTGQAWSSGEMEQIVTAVCQGRLSGFRKGKWQDQLRDAVDRLNVGREGGQNA